MNGSYGGGLGGSYGGGLGGSYGGEMYGNSMYRGGYGGGGAGGLYGGSGMYGGGMYNGGLRGPMGGYGMGMGHPPYANQDPNNPFGAPPSPPGFWVSFLRLVTVAVKKPLRLRISPAQAHQCRLQKTERQVQEQERKASAVYGNLWCIDCSAVHRSQLRQVILNCTCFVAYDACCRRPWLGFGTSVSVLPRRRGLAFYSTWNWSGNHCYGPTVKVITTT